MERAERISSDNHDSYSQYSGMMTSARIHEYKKSLVIDRISKPIITQGEEVLVRVGAAGLCHSDLHLMSGEWQDAIPVRLPLTPGHEIAGWVEDVGDSVPNFFINEGDLVAIFGGWGCGVCRYCKNGDEHLCSFPRWPGLSSYEGGFSEHILVPSYRFLIKVDKRFGIDPEELAPLTDAGLTPYRAIKKIRHLLGPDKSIAVVGIGGLGSYGIQYAKIIGQSANVIAIDIDDTKLELAERFGADHVINTTKSKNLRSAIMNINEGRGIDVVLDCVGTENTISDSIGVLSKGGTLVVVGLFGSQIRMPLVQSVINEYHLYGSLWGNYNELCEVIELAKRGKIKHSIQKFALDDINEAITLLRDGQINGRAVIIPPSPSPP
jgi:alcohol dehydrogenase, propanol-preferring